MVHGLVTAPEINDRTKSINTWCFLKYWTSCGKQVWDRQTVKQLTNQWGRQDTQEAMR